VFYSSCLMMLFYLLTLLTKKRLYVKVKSQWLLVEGIVSVVLVSMVEPL